MMKLYREHVLKEQPGPALVQIGSVAPEAPAPAAKPLPKVVRPVPAPKTVEEREEVGSFGD